MGCKFVREKGCKVQIYFRIPVEDRDFQCLRKRPEVLLAKFGSHARKVEYHDRSRLPSAFRKIRPRINAKLQFRTT